MENLLKKEVITVELYDSSRKADWDEYVQRSPQSVLAHTLGWKSVVEETYGHQAFYLMAYRGGSVVGILPLFLIKSLIFGGFLVTSPYLTFGGIVCEDEETANALTDRTKQISRECRVDYAEVRNQISYPCFKHTKPIYCSPILDLTVGEEEIWRNLKISTRWNIKKGRKVSLEVVEGFKNLDVFVDIHSQMMRRLGTPSHSRRFFYNIMKMLPGAHLLMVRLGNKYISGTLLTRHKDIIEMPWAPCLRKYYKTQANSFMYWEAIAWACRNGFRCLDFGRSKWDSGTFEFKSQFGAQPLPLYYQYYLNRAREVPSIDPENSKFKMLISIWQKLPLPLVKAVGPWIIRDIP